LLFFFKSTWGFYINSLLLLPLGSITFHRFYFYAKNFPSFDWAKKIVLVVSSHWKLLLLFLLLFTTANVPALLIPEHHSTNNSKCLLLVHCIPTKFQHTIWPKKDHIAFTVIVHFTVQSSITVRIRRIFYHISVVGTGTTSSY
jgi:hypothetical protein